MNETWKRNMFRNIQTQKCKESTGENAVSVHTETKWLVVRQVLQSVNCAPARQLNGWVGYSAEPVEVHWDEEMANKRKIETKHFRTYSNSKIKLNWQKCSVFSNRNTIFGSEAGNVP